MALEREGMEGEWRKVAGTGISLLMGGKKAIDFEVHC